VKLLIATAALTFFFALALFRINSALNASARGFRLSPNFWSLCSHRDKCLEAIDARVSIVCLRARGVVADQNRFVRALANKM
jgi:hypothetical protein